MDKQDMTKVVEHWGVTPPEYLKSFYGFPPLRAYFNACISSDRGAFDETDRNWCEKWTVEEYLKDRMPVGEVLSLCCGFGHIERILADMDVFYHCTGLDASEGAVRGAIKNAKQGGYTGIDYQLSDLNNAEFEKEKYDLIYANGAMHHITNLEHLTAEIFKALKPGGIFVCNEYIGPKFQELPHRQQELVNAVIHLIPDRLRNSKESTFIPAFYLRHRWLTPLYVAAKSLSGGIDVRARQANPQWSTAKSALFKLYKAVFALFPRRRKFRFGQIWQEESHFIKLTDPSECVRSDEIIAALSKQFQRLDIMHYNGSILKYALDAKFFDDYDPAKSEDRMLFEMLVNIEKTLIDMGELSSDHAHIVAIKETETT